MLHGYPILLIYLHHIATKVAGAMREDFEIIDGQQRITSLSDYKDGAFKLFDPVQDAEEARFQASFRSSRVRGAARPMMNWTLPCKSSSWKRCSQS